MIAHMTPSIRFAFCSFIVGWIYFYPRSVVHSQHAKGNACRFYVGLASVSADGGIDRGSMRAETCISSCVEAYPECVAVDYGKKDSKCYHHRPNVDNVLQWNNCCYRYELICSTNVCQGEFVRFESLEPTKPGVQQLGKYTVLSCLEACLNTFACSGFVFAKPSSNRDAVCALSTSEIHATTQSADYDLYVRGFCQTIRRVAMPTAVALRSKATKPKTSNKSESVEAFAEIIDPLGMIRFASNESAGLEESGQASTESPGNSSCLGIWDPPLFDRRNVAAVPTLDRTLVDCQSHCARDSFCVGIDADSRDDSHAYCWLILRSGSEVLFAGVARYKLRGREDGCGFIAASDGCSGRWSEPAQHQRIVDGAATNDKTLADCQDHCLRSRKCVGIDFYVDQKDALRCWFNARTGKLKATHGSTHYELTSREGCHGPVFWETSKQRRSASAMCSFYMTLDSVSANDATDEGVMSADDCLSRCVEAYPKCEAADVGKRDSKCYHHRPNSNSVRKWNDCCVRYELQCLAPTCQDDFTKFDSLESSSVTGLQHFAAQTADICDEVCRNMVECTAFLFARSNGTVDASCILSMTEIDATKESTDYDLYVKAVCHPLKIAVSPIMNATSTHPPLESMASAGSAIGPNASVIAASIEPPSSVSVGAVEAQVSINAEAKEPYTVNAELQRPAAGVQNAEQEAYENSHNAEPHTPKTIMNAEPEAEKSVNRAEEHASHETNGTEPEIPKGAQNVEPEAPSDVNTAEPQTSKYAGETEPLESHNVESTAPSASVATEKTLINCSGVWGHPHPDQRDSDAIPTLDATLPECQDHCARDSFCVGIDFDARNESNASCWMVLETAKKVPLTGMTHYNLRGRSEGCKGVGVSHGCAGSWSEPYLHQSIVHGHATNHETLADCQEHCLHDRKCVGIDFRLTPGSSLKCYFNAKTGKLKSTYNSTHYELTGRFGCHETIFRHSTERSRSPFDVCPFYHELYFARVTGGSFTGNMTVEQCIGSCLTKYPRCVSVDYGLTDSSCYQQDADITVTRHWSTCCTRYELQCLTSTCKEQFAHFPRREPAVRGEAQVDISTRDVCQDTCLAKNTCFGFAFSRMSHSRGADCLLSTTVVSATIRSAQYDLYVRQFCRKTRRNESPIMKNMEPETNASSVPPIASINPESATSKSETTTTTTVTATINTGTTTTSVAGATLKSRTPTTNTNYSYEPLIMEKMEPSHGTNTRNASINSKALTSESEIAIINTGNTTTSAAITLAEGGAILKFRTTTAITNYSHVNSVFAAGHNGHLNGPGKRVHLDCFVTGGTMTASLTAYTAPSNGLYFAEICVGVPIGRSSTASLVEGEKPVLGLLWQSRIHGGDTTACRSGILKLARDVPLSMSLDRGSVFSDHLETMMNVFSLSDALSHDGISRTVFAVGTPPRPGTTEISSKKTVGKSAADIFDETTSSYKCTTSGLYLFTMTAGIKGFEPSGMELVGLSYPFRMLRTSKNFNGVTTLSRSILMPCDAGISVRPQLLSGNIVDAAPYELITFGVFPYLTKSGVSAAWILTKNLTSGREDPFKFNEVVFNENGLYDPSSRLVTIRTSGIYYVYISSGLCRGQFLIFRLVRNDRTLFMVNHQAMNYDGDDGVGHGAVLALGADDRLKVAMDEETYSCSSPTGHETMFFGLLLFPF